MIRGTVLSSVSSGKRLSLFGCVLLVLLSALAPTAAQAKGSRYGLGALSELRPIEKLLEKQEWDRALAEADEVLLRLAARDYRGPKSRPVYGLGFAFRALAAEELGRHHEANWDWGCARALASEVVDYDFSPLGGAQARIVERERRRGAIPPTPSDLEEEYGRERVTEPKKLKAWMRGYPEAMRNNHREGTTEFRVRIGLDGLPSDPRPTSDEDLTSETAFFVWSFQVVVDWRFEPAKLDGAYVETAWDLTVNYRLR